MAIIQKRTLNNLISRICLHHKIGYGKVCGWQLYEFNGDTRITLFIHIMGVVR